MISCTRTAVLVYWLLAKYGTQRDDCYKHIANGLINHVVRVLEAHLGALELICSQRSQFLIMEVQDS